jgi:hypothetical protein
MRRICIALLAVFAAAGQEKPDPIQKARELLDGVAEMLGGVPVQIQVAGLWQLGENYQAFDRKKALEFYRQAWAAVPMLPPDLLRRHDRRLQTGIVRSAADVDPDLAIEMALQIASPPQGETYDTRLFASVKIIQVLVQKSELGKAMAFLETMGGKGAYSFSGASILFGALPADDARRQALFGSAHAAFNLRPDGAFALLLASHWKDVSPSMAKGALASYLNFVLDRKEQDGKGYETITYATARGTASFQTPQERELFDVMWLVREIEPKRAEEILQKYPTLKATLEVYPKGTRSMRAEGPFYTYSTRASEKTMQTQSSAEQFRMRAMMQARSEEVVQEAMKDPDKGIEMVRSIGSPAKQAEVLAAIARSVGEKDPAKARSVLGKCMAAIEEVKDPGERIPALDTVAEAAHGIKDGKLVQEALERGLSAAAELRKWDSEDSGHTPEEFWPSTTAYRRMMMRAARVLETDAEHLLHKIGEPSANLLARIAVAQALLGREQKFWQPYTPRRRPRN